MTQPSIRVHRDEGQNANMQLKELYMATLLLLACVCERQLGNFKCAWNCFQILNAGCAGWTDIFQPSCTFSIICELK